MIFFDKTNLIFGFATFLFCSSAWAESVYWQEFLAIKSNLAYDMVFDKELSPIVQTAARNIENIKRAGPAARLIRPIIVMTEGIIIEERTMPLLYDYVQRLSIQHEMEMPIVAILPYKGFLNAIAEKILISSGTIVLGRDLLKECTQEEVEAVIAHEMGHIKYEHVNKMYALDLARIIILAYLYKQELLGGWSCIALYMFMPYLLINKRFEWEADEFACRDAFKGKGLIKFFERLKAKEEKLDTDLARLHARLTETESRLSESMKSEAWQQYTFAKWSTALIKSFIWLYHNTPIGAHPATDLRLENAQRIAQEQEKVLQQYSEALEKEEAPPSRWYHYPTPT